MKRTSKRPNPSDGSSTETVTPVRTQSVYRVAIGIVLVGVIVLIVWTPSYFSSQPELLEVTGPTMATSYTVKIIGSSSFSPAMKDKINQVISAELALINSTMSSYYKGSDIDRFNRFKETTAFPVVSEVAYVVARSLEISKLTKGAFDITVGPLVKLWGFDEKKALAKEPAPDLIQKTLLKVGYLKLKANEETDTLSKEDPDLDLNLSGVAKGYAVDRIAMALDRLGYGNYLVEVGGEVRCKGKNLKGESWRVAVEKPLDHARDIYRVVSLKDATMSTSGDYRNFYNLEGQRVSHTIDPRSGKPVAHNLASVSVIHESCMIADALATALNVLGPKDGLTLAEDNSLAVLFILRGEDGSFTHMMTKAGLPYFSSE